MDKKSRKQTETKLLNAFIAVVLILALISGNFLFLGKEVIAATSQNLNMQTEDTLNKNIKFDTFFETDNERTHYLVCDVNEQMNEMKIKLSVKEGYLQNASIEFVDKNYVVYNIIDEAQVIQEATNEGLSLKQINSNTDVSLILNISANIEEHMKLEDLNKESKIILKGTYIDLEGKESKIEKEISLGIELKQEIQPELKQEINSYFSFQKDNKNKVLVRVNANLVLPESEKGYLPREKTQITVELPKLNGVLPESVNIIPKNTEMTNGKIEENVNYKDEDFSLNLEENTATFVVENPVVEGSVWAGNGKDEYMITYIYPEQAMVNIPVEGNQFTSKISAKMKLFNEVEITSESKENFLLVETTGNIIDIEVGSSTANINKGKMYANSIREVKEYETNYNIDWKVDVSNKEMLDGIKIVDKNEIFMDINKNAYSTTIGMDNYTYYTETKISKDNFLRILGENGSIQVLNQYGMVVNQINKDTEQDEDGNLVIKYADKNLDRMIMETTKPEAEGMLYIKHEKAIKAELPYDKIALQNFDKLVEQVTIMQKQAQNYMSMKDAEMSIDLVETSTNAEIELSKTVLSTVVTNEDVEIKIALDNNRIETDLYVNPAFLVELPEYIEDINIKEANVLFDENLQIQEIEKLEQEGKIFLRIILSGTQDGFSTGSFTKGTNIVLNTDIKAKLLTPNKEDEIKLYYANPNAITYVNSVQIGEQNLGASSTGIEFSAPSGMVAVSNILNYENTGKSVISVKQGTVTDKIDIYADAKTATMQVMMINNTGNDCNNVMALGRIPFKGNKNIESDTELGTTLDTVLKSSITAEGIESENVIIYYSVNGEATNDINDTKNAWTTEPSDLSLIKSYLIVLKDYEMQTGEILKFKYDFEIPANLEHENSFYGSFGMYYTNKTNVGNKDEKTIADIVGLTTGEGPKLSVDQAISVGENNPVQEGQIVKVTVKVSNTGSVDIENAKLRNYIPQYTRYTVYQEASGSYGEVSAGYIYPATKKDENNKEYIEIELGTIKVGESATKEIELEIEKLPTFLEYYQNTPGFAYDEESGKYYIYETNEENEIVNTVEVTSMPEISMINEVEVYATDLDRPMTHQSKGNKIEKSYFKINERSSIDQNVILEEGQEIIYYIDVKNISEETLSDIIVEKILPVGLNYKESYVITYNEESGEWDENDIGIYIGESGTTFWNVDEIDAGQTISLKLICEAAKIEDGKYEQEIKTKTSAYANNVGKHVSGDTINTVGKANIETKIISNASKQYIAEGDKIAYTISVKNTGKVIAKNVQIQDVLPQELRYIGGNYKIVDGNIEGKLNEYNSKIDLALNIKPDTEAILNIEAEAKNLPNDVDEKQITNYATLQGDNISKLETEKLTNIIEQSPDKPNPPQESPNSNGGSGSTENNPDGGNTPNNGGNTPNVEKTFKIRGFAWIDENQNGVRENNEQFLEGIKVVLVNASTGETIKDKDSKEDKQTTTAKDGSYVFENLDKGEYNVVFYYNNQLYAVTDYKKSGVSEAQNSDVIASKKTENGVDTEVAVTNTIKLTSSSYANIDMGLIYKNKFDIKLDKFISKITVQNKEGVKTYNFTDSTLAQVPITGKQLAGSIIVTEYKIKVTNEGNIPGYVKNIVDYMPKEMKFNSDLNSNWYAGNDGYLYNTELANTIINPNETKEVSLVLTKQMADSSTVMVNNLAEVYEEYNELGIKDLDSTVKNQAQGEDDLGSANMIITVKTGATVTYVGVVLVSLVVLAGGIYFIKKKYTRYYN